MPTPDMLGRSLACSRPSAPPLTLRPDIPIVPDASRPDWMTVTPTSLLAAAKLADLSERGATQEETALELEQHALDTGEGTALHLSWLLRRLFDELRPAELPRWEDYRQNLNGLDRLLPTTPPEQVLHIRRLLERKELALSKSDHGAAETTCRDILDSLARQDLTDHPPFVDSYPLFGGEEAGKPFLDPDRLEKRWRQEVSPDLAEKFRHLRAFEDGRPFIGMALSDVEKGRLFRLPELRTTVIAGSLGLTLNRRADELTRQEQNGFVTIEETDLKSGKTVHQPEEGSQEETAFQMLLYLGAIGILDRDHLEQEKPGYSLACYPPMNPYAPRTLCEYDQLVIEYVAVGGDEPQRVDFAEVYNPIFTDPTAARDLLVRSEQFLTRVRENPALRRVASAVRKKKP